MLRLKDPKVQSHEVGAFVVSLTATACRDTSLYTDTIEISLPVIVNQKEANKTEVLIYPNPAGDLITVEVNARGSKELEIYGLKGELITQYQIGEHNFKLTIDTMGWVKGIYFCQLTINGSIQEVKRFIIE